MSDSRSIPEDASEELRSYFVAKQGIAKNSYKDQKSVATRFEEWLQEERGADSLLDAKQRDVHEWLLQFVEQGHNGSTINQYHTDLRSVYNAWTDGDNDGSMLEGELDNNPADYNLTDWIDIDRDAEKQTYADNDEGVIYLDQTEVRQLREHVPKPKVRNDLIIRLLVQTGLRRGELAELRIDGRKDHLDREAQKVTITTDTSKTDEGRTVPYDDLDPELSMWLDGGYRDRHPDAEDSPYLLLNRQSPKLSPSRISSIVREAVDNAGLDDKYMEVAGEQGGKRRRVTAHTLRATFTMRLLENGVPTPKVMKLTGHENLETVESYANVIDEDAIDAYRETDIDWS